MTRLAALGCSALLASVFAASACSEDTPPPLDPGHENGGEANGGSASRGGSAGRGGAVGEGGDESGGAHPGGAPGALGGEGSGLSGGAGGEPPGGGGQPEPPPPPDLVTSNGGPWPDSATGRCSNGTTLSACPQKGDAFFGQDGTYRLNVPTYVATASTLTDEITELVWQLAPPLEPLTQAEAETYCEELELAGETDWRLPTRREYVSLLDEGKGAGYALPAAIPFSSTGTCWTSSESGVTPGLFFVVNDEEGTWNVVVEESPYAARCVRGAALDAALETGAGVVTDTGSSLTWHETEEAAEPRTWQEALEYCEALSVAGKDDWRLPNIKELATLVDESVMAAPVLAAAFGSEAARKYWSSTPAGQFLTDQAVLGLDTDFGSSVSIDMNETSAARCVRTAD
jgi:hypothetical protein